MGPELVSKKERVLVLKSVPTMELTMDSTTVLMTGPAMEPTWALKRVQEMVQWLVNE